MRKPSDSNLSPQQKRRAFVIAIVVGVLLFIAVEKEMVHSDDHLPPSEIQKILESERFTGHEDISTCVGKVPFPRRRIVGCEGYWAPYTEEGGAPINSAFPVFRPADHQSPFCGSVEWLRQLDYIEKVAADDSTHDFPPSGLTLSRQRGMSPSRVDGKLLGNKEFRDYFALTDSYMARSGGEEKKIVKEPDVELFKKRQTDLKDDDTVCWTGDFGPYYIRKFNAVPSQEFHEYILSRYAVLHS
jgi:hypothetical protein